eukprot:325656-Pelagomonas_calceolata.AAC.2
MPQERTVQCERLQVPELDGFVCACGGQLLAVRRDEALEDISGMGTELVQWLKVCGVCAACEHQNNL